jgi:hypothetical protein
MAMEAFAQTALFFNRQLEIYVAQGLIPQARVGELRKVVVTAMSLPGR